MRKGWIGIGLIAAFVLAPMQSQAQVTLGPTLAFHDDFDFGVGAMLGAPLESFGDGIGLLADFTWFFPDGTGIDYFEINGNVTYDFPLQNSTVVPFALGGINIARVSFDAGVISGSDTEIGLNLGGGVKFDAGSLRPMAGIRVELNGGEGFVIFGAVPFELGG